MADIPIHLLTRVQFYTGDDMQRDKSEAGFSLLEMLIVLGVLLVVLGSAFALMKDSLSIGNTTFEMTEATQSLRVAQEYMNRDLTLAGAGLANLNIQVPKGFVTNYLAQNLVVDPANPASPYVPLPLIYSDANVPANTAVNGTAPVVNVLTGSDRITILLADSTFVPITVASGKISSSGGTVQVANADAATVNVGEIYFFSGATAAFGTITSITAVGVSGKTNLGFATADTYGLNKPVTGGPIDLAGAGSGGVSTQPVSMFRVNMVHYYINANNILMRRVYGVAGAGFTENIVAEHATNMQFRYFLNLFNADGSVQQPVNQFATPIQEAAVREIELSLFFQTTHNTTFVKNANGSVTGTPQQVSMKTNISLRNVQFGQAQQPQ